MKIVATTSLPAVDRPNADRWNAARSRQKPWQYGIKYESSNNLSSPPPIVTKYETCFKNVRVFNLAFWGQ